MMNIIKSVSENVLYCTRNFRRSKILMNNVLRNHEVLRWTEPILYAAKSAPSAMSAIATPGGGVQEASTNC